MICAAGAVREPPSARHRRPACSATLTKENCMTRLARWQTLVAVVTLVGGLALPGADDD